MRRKKWDGSIYHVICNEYGLLMKNVYPSDGFPL